MSTSPESEPISVVYIEDDERLASLTAYYLQSHGERVTRKITGDWTGIQRSGCTTTMPLAGTMPTADEIQTIRSWIAAGATTS